MNRLKKSILQLLSVVPFFSSNAIGASKEISPIDARILKIRNSIHNSDEQRANKLLEYLFEPGRSIKDFDESDVKSGDFDNFDNFKAFDNFGKFDNFDNFKAFDNFGNFSNGQDRRPW